MPASSIIDKSNGIDNDPVHVSQDVANHSFASSSNVAVHSEHAPDKASFVSHACDLETTLQRPAAAGVSLANSSLTKMSHSDLEATVSFFERSGLGMPDSFVDSRVVIFYSDEFNFVIGVILLLIPMSHFVCVYVVLRILSLVPPSEE